VRGPLGKRRDFMKILSRLVASVGAVLLTATLMGLPDLSMAEVPGVSIAGIHAPVAVGRAP
jgi:hypothetical protein